MTRIDSLPYPVLVGGGSASELAAFVAERGYRRIVVLCDERVAAHAERVTKRLRGVVARLPFALGERRKRLGTVERVLDALTKSGADRKTLVVGAGGGVAGDLFGFAASIYMRGVPFVNVATSLVAMVDASIGGKTGVDLAAGKNLAGTFRDPVAVFCDTEALPTLPERAFREGLAEFVKHGIIEGGETFDGLETLAPHPLRKWPWETVVADSVKIKAMVVNDDREEAGLREVLNLGHTFAHAIESVSRYRVSHGNAVAVGLRAAGLLALRTGRFSAEEHLRVLSLLALLRLPLHAEGEPDAWLAAMAHDKKTRAGTLRFVLPRAIGDVEHGIEVPKASVRAVLRRISEPPGRAEFR
jgi:3-dehydroquinate synthase